MQARAVVVVDGRDLVLFTLGAADGSIDGKIAALGVAADAQNLCGKGRSRPRKILRSLLLCGHGGHEGHVEIFFPADDGIIGAAEGEIHAAVAAADAQRRKLYFGFCVQRAAVAAQTHLAEPARRGGFTQKRRDGVGHQHAHIGRGMQGKIALSRFAQADRVGKRFGHNAAKIQITQFG